MSGRALALLLALAGGCSADPIAVPADCPGTCDDDDPCTDDRCLPSGACSHLPTRVVDACQTDFHCDDHDACTSDACVAVAGCGFSRCEHARIDCGDGDRCTEDRCDAELGCSNVPLDVANACTVAADCDDGDACSDDSCEPSPGCPFSRCAHARAPGGCLPCDDAFDCGAPCQSSQCVDGRCVYGPEEPRCDYRCHSGPLVASNDLFGHTEFRGFAAPIDDACDGDACTCTRDLVLAGADARLALVLDGSGTAWGHCEVDVCGGPSSCAPLVAARGYYVNGGRAGPSPTAGAPGAPSFALWIDYYCLATHSDLMVGDWLGTLTPPDGTAVAFVAHVDPPLDASDRETHLVIAEPATAGAVTIAAQTFTLPGGGRFRLDTALETSIGRFEGTLFSGPDALEGDLRLPSGATATLRLEPRP
ncbi:MAG: hypothetical protein U1F43_01810 [Myxococcota bacterium]